MAEGSLQVDVLTAHGLETPEGGQLQRYPYVFLSCGHGLHRRTRTIRDDGGANPVWNQTFLFEIPDGVYIPELIVAIYDQERHGTAEGSMGIAIISLERVYAERQIGASRYKIQQLDEEKQQGEIELALKFFPKTRHGSLHLHLVQARGLRQTDILAKIDPYAVITYGRQSLKSRTLKNAGRKPFWDENFVLEMDSDESLVVIKLFDKDRFTRDDPLGNAQVPLSRVFAEKHVPPTYYKVIGKQGRVQGEVQVGLQYHPR